MKPKKHQSKDRDMEMSATALIRAAKRARELARQTGTEYVVMRDGKLVREIPQREDAGSDDAQTA